MRLIDKNEVMKKLSIADECEDCPFCSEEIFCGKQQDPQSFVDACEAICDAPVVEIIHCKECKYAEVVDPEDGQDGYTCQFHRGSIWFSGSYCSWAERGQDEQIN